MRLIPQYVIKKLSLPHMFPNEGLFNLTHVCEVTH